MMQYLVNALFVAVAFLGMEGVAWLTHKYIMHGVLWSLHHDHHNKPVESVLEKNDFFFLIFSIPGIAGLLVGLLNDYNYFFWFGLGITIYGFVYFIVHDVFIHQRLPFLKRSDSAYFRAIRKAHKVHHKHLVRVEGECFGMLWVPWKYFKEASKAKSGK